MTVLTCVSGTLGTYLSHRYGNPAGSVTAAQVSALRGGGEHHHWSPWSVAP